MRSHPLACVLFTGVLIGAGCVAGGDAPGSAAASGAPARSSEAADRAAPDAAQNACALLTRDEAAAAVGSAVAEGKLTAGRSMAGAGIEVSGCSYGGGSMKELNVSLWRFTPSAKQSLEVYRGLCRKKEQAAGLGDLACWYNADHNELQVLKGSTLLIFQLSGRHGAGDALVTAAKQALSRLE
jgi:hypothetical protein